MYQSKERIIHKADFINNLFSWMCNLLLFLRQFSYHLLKIILYNNIYINVFLNMFDIYIYTAYNYVNIYILYKLNLRVTIISSSSTINRFKCWWYTLV